jgi:hypothetical protein
MTVPRKLREPRSSNSLHVPVSISLPIYLRDSLLEAAVRDQRSLSSMISKAAAFYLARLRDKTNDL